MSDKNQQKIALFEGKQIRRYWDGAKEIWYFSIVDVVAALTGQPDHKRAQSYWTTLKNRLKEEGSEVVTKCDQLKMLASDGKFYLTDAADTEIMLRLVQSIPSPNAEPFKLWLARVGYERLEETADPELAINRALKIYLQKGYSKEWINQRLKSIEVRKELTDEWQERGMKEGLKYAILTDEITRAWADKSVRDYKKFKGLKKENLRDNMTNLELVLNMLAEASTAEISKKKTPNGLESNKRIARMGGTAAKKARIEIEKQTGESVIISKNAKSLMTKEKKSLSNKGNIFQPHSTHGLTRGK